MQSTTPKNREIPALMCFLSPIILPQLLVLTSFVSILLFVSGCTTAGKTRTINRQFYGQRVAEVSEEEARLLSRASLARPKDLDQRRVYQATQVSVFKKKEVFKKKAVFKEKQRAKYLIRESKGTTFYYGSEDEIPTQVNVE